VQDDLRGILFILSGMLLFSVQDVLIRMMASEGSLVQIMVFRGLLGCLVLMAFLRLTGRSIQFSSAYPALALIRILLFFSGFLAFYFSLSGMSLAEATSLFFVSPIFITIISKLVFKNDVGWYRGAAIIVGFIGVLMIIKPSPGQFNAIALLPVFTALGYAIAMMIARHTRDKDSIFQQMLQLYMGSAVFGILAALLLHLFGVDAETFPQLDYLVRSWSFDNPYLLLAMATVAAFGSLGMLLLTSAYRVGSPPVLAPFEYSLLLLAALFGYLLFGEIPDILSGIGMVIIVVSGLFIFIREGVRRKPLAVKTSLRT